MGGLEFYTIDNELWCRHADGRNEIFDENSTEIIQFMLDKIKSCYPEAYEHLRWYYEKSSHNYGWYRYLMVRRFIKCNFSQLDTTTYDVENVTADGKFNFEKVACPLRGECSCEGRVCCPKFNSKLSQAEMRVMKPYYKGRSKDEIAQALFLSPETVKNHIKNAYLKLGVHEKAEFIRYAQENHLFSN